MEHWGFWSIVPTVSVLLLALLTRKTFEALLGGALIGFSILSPMNFFSGFTNSLLEVMQDPTIGWVILVCGLFGSLIHLLVKSGGATAFAGRPNSMPFLPLTPLIVFINTMTSPSGSERETHITRLGVTANPFAKNSLMGLLPKLPRMLRRFTVNYSQKQKTKVLPS